MMLWHLFHASFIAANKLCVYCHFLQIKKAINVALSRVFILTKAIYACSSSKCLQNWIIKIHLLQELSQASFFATNKLWVHFYKNCYHSLYKWTAIIVHQCPISYNFYQHNLPCYQHTALRFYSGYAAKKFYKIDTSAVVDEKVIAV
jgi:hypothetical protein